MHDLTVRFWGTRGSIPVPGPRTAKYGGNTACLEILYRDTRIIVDAGSGIRQLGRSFSQSASSPIHLLLTHSHWDHIQGLPFFAPVYSGQNKIIVIGNDHPEQLSNVMRGQMSMPYFPVPFEAVAENFNVRRAQPFFEIGDIQVRSQPLPHPGGCLGYRFEAGGQTIVLATDCELESLGSDAGSGKLPWDSHPKLLDFFEGADLIVIDCQYTDQEYRQRVGWGHNSVSAVVDVCRRVGPETMVLFHHDPDSDDAKVDAMVESAKRRLFESGHFDSTVLAAREQSCLSVGWNRQALAV